MAGYDPSREADAKIFAAVDNTIQFTMDIAGGDTDGVDNDGDGFVDEADEAAFGDGAIVVGDGEEITYVHYDSDGDGNNDALGRNPGSGIQLLAENIDALNFVYLDADGGDLGSPVPMPKRQAIRTVQITLVARADFRDQDYNNNMQYENQNPKPGGPDVIYTAPGDGYRRKRLTTQIRCRNLGL